MDAVLVAEDVRRRYGETVALDGVSLSVNAGEVVALVGPNGAGKTTLVRALTGTIDHEGGVSLFGEHPRNVERSRLGLLPQSFDPPARLTARELIRYYGGLYDESRSVDDVLADVGLARTADTADATGAADTRYENLSGGQRRRTCVGTALVNDPDLLVLDEPTTGIDPAGRRALWDLLSGLAASGTTILLTTHYMEEAERLADRVSLLADGRMLTTGTPRELVAEHGGESRLAVDLAGDRSTDDAPADAALVRAFAEAGFDTASQPGELVVRDVAPERIGDVVDVLDAAGAAYDGLAWSEPDLEDVYLALAGTELAAGGEAVARENTENADHDTGAESRDHGAAVAEEASR